MSRMDEYLMAIITGENEDLPEPRSSTEREFYEAAKRGLGGGELPFGETTVMGDTLTWDGDMTGKVYAEMEYQTDEITTTAYLVKVSNAVPTIEELQGGGTTTAIGGGQEIVLEWGDGTDWVYEDMGDFIFDANLNLPIIAKEDNLDLTDTLGFILPKKGVYMMSLPAQGLFYSSFTINNYTGFESTEIKTIDPKYLSFDAFRTCFYGGEVREGVNAYELYVDDERTTLATYQDIENAYKKGQIVIIENFDHRFPTNISLVPPVQAILVVAYDGSGANTPNGTATEYKRYQVGSAD